MSADTSGKVATILQKILQYEAGTTPFVKNQTLVENGLDSFAIADLICELEITFDVQFTPEDLDIKHFQTLKTLVSFVDDRLAASKHR